MPFPALHQATESHQIKDCTAASQSFTGMASKLKKMMFQEEIPKNMKERCQDVFTTRPTTSKCFQTKRQQHRQNC